MPTHVRSSILSEITIDERIKPDAGFIFMPPTSEEVEGAYWFGSVRAVQVQCSQSVSQSVCLSVMCE